MSDTELCDGLEDLAHESELHPADQATEMVVATDGEGETAVMPRALFDDTYSRFGWTLVAEQPDPQWPTEDPDQPAWPTEDPDDTGRGPFDAYLPAEEHA